MYSKAKHLRTIRSRFSLVGNDSRNVTAKLLFKKKKCHRAQVERLAMEWSLKATVTGTQLFRSPYGCVHCSRCVCGGGGGLGMRRSSGGESGESSDRDPVPKGFALWRNTVMYPVSRAPSGFLLCGGKELRAPPGGRLPFKSEFFHSSAQGLWVASLDLSASTSQ